MTYQSLEQIGEDFVKAAQVETNSLFMQGEIVLHAAAQGFDIDELCGYCAGLAHRTKRTVYRYYKVARTFGKPHPALTTAFEIHAICADLIDYRHSDPDVIASQIEAARSWLEKAAGEAYSTRQLKAAMKANGDDPDKGTPTVILDNAPALVFDPVADRHYLKLYFVDGLDTDLKVGEEVIVSIMKAPAQETEAAA